MTDAELRAAAGWPNPYVTVGAELLPEYREFERGTTAAINGFGHPVIGVSASTAVEYTKPSRSAVTTVPPCGFTAM